MADGNGGNGNGRAYSVPAEITHPKKRAFLAAYAETGTVTHAAAAAQLSRRTPELWVRDDAQFSLAFSDAKEAAADRLEREAIRRAVEGTEEPIVYKGQVVGTVRRYSDLLLIFMLKAMRPEKYRETIRNEHTGAAGGPVSVRVAGPRDGDSE